jgi:hypothetical protein
MNDKGGYDSNLPNRLASSSQWVPRFLCILPKVDLSQTPPITFEKTI